MDLKDRKCGNCHYFDPYPLSEVMGRCVAQPPMMDPNSEAETESYYPTVASGTTGCAPFWTLRAPRTLESTESSVNA